MSRNYTPRRQSKRWLDGDCPTGVLAIYDSGPKFFDRFTVFYVGAEVDHNDTPWISYRGMSEHPAAPNGFGISGSMTRWDAQEYRYRNSHRAATWSSLPEDVKSSVRRDCEEWQK